MCISKCIFRYQYNNGNRCNEKTLEYSQYCKRHINKRNHIFEIMDQCLANNTVNTSTDLYNIFQYVHDLDTIENKNETFYNIASYLLSRMSIIAIISKLVKLDMCISKCNKRFIITHHLQNIYSKIYQISKDDDSLNYIIKIQRFMRRKLYQKITACNKSVSENNEDPFTFDTIDEIPPAYKFSYKDSKGHIYSFNAIEFEYFIRNNGRWNPYTKEEIPDNIINRLYLLILYNKLELKQEEVLKWQTPLQAYTDVSQVMEKGGFYTSVVWFEKINYNSCKNIIKRFRELSSGVPDGNMFFPITFEMNKSTYYFEFAKEIITLFKEYDSHYLLCCNFIKALAANIKEFYQNMPSWLLNLESSEPLNTNTNTNRNAIMFMYFQNMIDDVEENYEIDIDFDIIDRRYTSLTRGLYGMMYDRF